MASNLIRAWLAIAMSGVLFGYLYGYVSYFIARGQLLCDDRHAVGGTWTSVGYGQCYHLSNFSRGLLSAMALFGACVSSLVCFRYADDLGRKRLIQNAGVFYLLGSVLGVASPVLWLLAVGLFVYGLGVGFAVTAAPMYIAEIAPADLRGRLVASEEVVVVFGVFLGMVAGFALSSVGPFGWRLMAGVPGVIAIVMQFGLVGVPDSPRYLLLRALRQHAQEHGPLSSFQEEQPMFDTREFISERMKPDMTEVSASLQFFRQSATLEIEDELQSLYQDTLACYYGLGEDEPLIRKTQMRASYLEAFQYPKPMMICCGLVFLQQVTGQPTVLFYLQGILKMIGFDSSNASMAGVLLGGAKLLVSSLAAWRVDQYGRRHLLIICALVMAVALSVQVYVMAQNGDGCSTSIPACYQAGHIMPQPLKILSFVALMCIVGAYEIGFGPVTWIIIAEIFPLKVRGSAVSLAILVNFVCNIGVTMYAPMLMSVFTPIGLFSIFLIFAVATVAFVYAFVPETQGKTLEEVERLMNER